MHQYVLKTRLNCTGSVNLRLLSVIAALESHMEREIKDYKSTLESQEHALRIRLKLFGENHPDIARSYDIIGDVHSEMEYCKSVVESVNVYISKISYSNCIACGKM